MNPWTIVKTIGALVGLAVLLLGVWLVLSGKVGPLPAAEERAARERVQRQLMESQRQENLRRPFEAISFP